MKQTAKLGVTAKNRLCLPAVLALVLGLVPCSMAAVPGARSLPQTVIAYGVLRWDYVDLDRLFASEKSLPVIQDLLELDTVLKSLDCDIPVRLALPHRALILPPIPRNLWFGFERMGGRNSPDQGWLFIAEPGGGSSRRVLVVLSSASPERTTVFWLERADAGYAAKLIYDSMEKGRIANAATVLGAATEVRIEKKGGILLKDWGEPGVGPREFSRIDRIFRVDLSQGTVSLVSPGIPAGR